MRVSHNFNNLIIKFKLRDAYYLHFGKIKYLGENTKKKIGFEIKNNEILSFCVYLM